MPKYTLSHSVSFSKSETKNKINTRSCLFTSHLQVMVQKQNRHMSMSVYLAVLAVDDTIVLASGRKSNLLKYLITKPMLGLICTRRQRFYFNFSSWIGSIEISVGGFYRQEWVLHLFLVTKKHIH